MAKIITENFKVETTHELFNSFKNQNNVLASRFETELTALNAATFSNALDSGNIAEVKKIVEVQLQALRPESEYYIMASRALSNIDNVPTIQNTQNDKRDFQRKVIFGNKIDNDNARFMFYENPWTPGTVYDAYDDTVDIEKSNSIVSIRSSDDDYLIFKCIENNSGEPSYTSPQTVVADLTTTGYQAIETSDKYIWHYMFTVVASEAQIYKTSNSLPLPTSGGDNEVKANAKECVSQIIIEETPSNHFDQFVFNTGANNSRVGKNTQSALTAGRQQISLNVQNNSILSNAEDYYQNMYLRASDSGKLYEIIDSGSSSSLAEIVVTIKTSDTIPDNCELVPKVLVTSPGVGGVRARAYGVINRFGTLERIAYETKGSNYKFATAEVVNPKGLTDTSPTTLRVVVSPKGGHGSNPINEMAMSRLAIVTNFSGESESIPKSNYYTQVGLVKNPSFYKITGSGPYTSTDVSPGSFDNRTSLTISNDQTAVAVPGYYIQQYVETVNITELQAGKKYVINDLGNLSVSEWETMGVTSVDKINGEVIAGVKFIAASNVVVDSSKVAKIAFVVDAPDADKDIEIVKGLVHSSTYTGTTASGNTNKTVIKIINDSGDHQNDFLPGRVEIKPTEQSQSSNTLSINTFNDIEYGAYVSYSGELLHFIDFSPIERKPLTKEKIKFLFDF